MFEGVRLLFQHSTAVGLVPRFSLLFLTNQETGSKEAT